MVLFVGHSRPWCSENAGASIRYLESGDFIGRLCFLLGRSVPCRRRPAGDGAPSGPRVARVAHASLRSSDKRLRVTLRVATAPRREHRAHCELDRHPAKAIYKRSQVRIVWGKAVAVSRYQISCDFVRLPSIFCDPLRSMVAPRQRERMNSPHKFRRKFGESLPCARSR